MGTGESVPVTSRDGAGNGRGFPPAARQTGIPSVFFSDVLPQIRDEAELVVSLYVFYLLGRKRGSRRWFVDAELYAEEPLLRALDRLTSVSAAGGAAGGDARAAVRRGLDAAVGRGTLLRALRKREGRELRLYAVNVPGAAEMLARLGAAIDLPALDEDDAGEQPVIANIFVLYEENVGVVSPLLAEELRLAEQEYPWPWIEAAFREAVALNRRSWRYIERILQRWRTEGPDLEAIRRTAERSGRRSLAGRYWRLVKR